jgi:hypothetical protein
MPYSLPEEILIKIWEYHHQMMMLYLKKDLYYHFDEKKMENICSIEWEMYKIEQSKINILF